VDVFFIKDQKISEKEKKNKKKKKKNPIKHS